MGARLLFVFLVLLLTPMVGQARNPIDDYRWKNRLIVLYFPDSKAGRTSLEAFERMVIRERREILDRDLLLFHTGPLPRKTPFWASALSDSDRASLRAAYALGGDEAQLVLVGKDGGVKRRQSGPDLDLGSLFRLIDTMPMRRDEMGK